MLKIVFWWLLAVNVLTFVVYWFDKRRAEKGGRRVAERELLLWAIIGGSLGAFVAMQKFRHKTRKRWFKIAFWAVVAVQLVGLWLLVRF